MICFVMNEKFGGRKKKVCILKLIKNISCNNYVIFLSYEKSEIVCY